MSLWLTLHTTCLPNQPQALSLHSALAMVHYSPSEGSKGHPEMLNLVLHPVAGPPKGMSVLLLHPQKGHSGTSADRNIYGGLNPSFPTGQPGLQGHSMPLKHRESRVANLAPRGESALGKSQYSVLQVKWEDLSRLPEGVRTQPSPVSASTSGC